MGLTIRTSTIILSFAFSVLGHSHVDEIWAPNPSIHYQGWDPNEFDTVPYPNDKPGWYTENQGGNPLYPIALNTYDIICARHSSPANISAEVAPGDTVRVKWWNPGPWPNNHKGPVLDYLAPVNGPASEVDPTTLKFVKISELGWIGDHYFEEYWATDVLLDDDSSWNVKVPEGLKAGEYVLRTELIALHLANYTEPGPYSPIGAEFYPQCINLKVTGDGNKEITGGVDARTLYNGEEPGIAYKTLHDGNEHADYIIPGPPVWSGALKRRSFRG